VIGEPERHPRTGTFQLSYRIWQQLRVEIDHYLAARIHRTLDDAPLRSFFQPGHALPGKRSDMAGELSSRPDPGRTELGDLVTHALQRIPYVIGEIVRR
jgi:hypothetical protein